MNPKVEGNLNKINHLLVIVHLIHLSFYIISLHYLASAGLVHDHDEFEGSYLRRQDESFHVRLCFHSSMLYFLLYFLSQVIARGSRRMKFEWNYGLYKCIVLDVCLSYIINVRKLYLMCLLPL